MIAIAKRMAKTTICSTSLRAIASMIDVGTRWSMKLVSVGLFCASCCPVSAVATARFTPSPGRVRFTAPSPMNRAIVVTISK